jgi:GNAT superfamily N-acetyltransferase
MPSLDDLLAEAPGTSVVDELRPVFDRTHAGVTVRLDSAQRTTTGLTVQGRFYDDLGGQQVGSLSRELRDINGERSVYNAYLRLDADHQGQGFVTAYFDDLEDWYRANGVRFIDVHANIDIGGYTWATKGFDWQKRADGSPDMGDVPRRLAREIVRMPQGVQRVEAEAILAGLEDPSRWWTDTMVSPKDIARHGRAAARAGETWVGKRAMLGSSWHGRKML